MKFKSVITVLFSMLLFNCKNVESESLTTESKNNLETVTSKTNNIDSIEYFLIDTITKEFWFDKFYLVFYNDSSYKFDFEFWGGYQANENGPYYIKGDSLFLVSSLGNTERLLIFKNDIAESDFYATSGFSPTNFFPTKYLKVDKFNIDANANNPAINKTASKN